MSTGFWHNSLVSKAWKSFNPSSLCLGLKKVWLKFWQKYEQERNMSLAKGWRLERYCIVMNTNYNRRRRENSQSSCTDLIKEKQVFDSTMKRKLSSQSLQMWNYVYSIFREKLLPSTVIFKNWFSLLKWFSLFLFDDYCSSYLLAIKAILQIITYVTSLLYKPTLYV